MAQEVKSKGVKVEVLLAPSTKKRFAAKAKKANQSMSQVLRDFVQSYVKG